MNANEILAQYHFDGRIVDVSPLGNGNVNDTYLAVVRNTFDETQLVLQRINTNVFKNPEAVMRNMRTVTDHCHKKLQREINSTDRVWQMPKLIPTRNGSDFVKDENGNYWRVITRILSASSFDTAQSTDHARECGAALGHFHYLVSDLNPELLEDPLPGFHNTLGYLESFDKTVAENPIAKERLSKRLEARSLSVFVNERRDLAAFFANAEKSGAIKRHMFHGDPKVNNIMIDNFTGLGTAMIDLDTVSPGLVQIDFGDAIRSICNPAGEETENLNAVKFDETLFTAFCQGYISEAEAFLSPAEKSSLYEAVRLLPFELGLRFFQDYLAGDKYFKTTKPGQNLNRAMVQFRLCEEIEAHELKIRRLLKSL